MFDKCDRCGGPLTNGYETRDFRGNDATGYADVEFICADCIGEESPSTVLVMAGDQNHAWDHADAGNNFVRCFFQYPDRIEILGVTYDGVAQ